MLSGMSNDKHRHSSRSVYWSMAWSRVADLRLILKAGTQSQETPHRWQQPCRRPDEVLIKFQRGCCQSYLARVAAAQKPASNCGHLLFRPGFGKLCFEVLPKAAAGGILRRAGAGGAADSRAAPPAAKIHCCNYTFYQVMFVSGKDL